MKRKVKPRLNEVDARNVRAKVECEGGMDYTFRFQTNFPEVKDKKFRKLYKAYIKAAQELADYCGLDDEPYDEVDAEGNCHSCGLRHHPDEGCPDTCRECGTEMDDDGCPYGCLEEE